MQALKNLFSVFLFALFCLLGNVKANPQEQQQAQQWWGPGFGGGWGGIGGCGGPWGGFGGGCGGWGSPFFGGYYRRWGW